jgi:hypothetical protein
MSKWRIPFKNTVISSDAIPAAGAAGGKANDPVRDRGLNAVNLWGTGAAVSGTQWQIAAGLATNQYSGGVGVPVGRAMLALDGVIVSAVNVVTTALKENDPVYITAGNLLTSASAGNTLYGYADEPGPINAATVMGVRISNAIGA